MTRRNSDEAGIGEDAFMDTIANLVGIMIILVVIVGARGYTSAKSLAKETQQEKIDDLKAPLEVAKNLERDLESLSDELRKYDVEVAYRNAERLTLVDKKTVVEHQLNETVGQLDTQSQQSLALDNKLSELSAELEKINQQQGQLPESQRPIVALQHLPTPMAKTVFGKEIHVMLRDSRVTVIPWDTLIEQLKSQVRTSVARQANRPKIEDTLGPIDGFIMRYRLLSKAGLMSDGRVAAMGRMVELERFELEPTPEIFQESVAQSLGSGGRLRNELDASRSGHTTVTVWVYPESFSEYRTLRDQLFQEGFLSAARPLPRNMRIGASPNGSSSAAQ
jgi:hypothetical protein